MNGMVRLARCWVTFDFVKWRVAEGDCLGEQPYGDKGVEFQQKLGTYK